MATGDVAAQTEWAIRPDKVYVSFQVLRKLKPIFEKTIRG